MAYIIIKCGKFKIEINKKFIQEFLNNFLKSITLRNLQKKESHKWKGKCLRINLGQKVLLLEKY